MKTHITIGLMATLTVSASAQVIGDRATLNGILGTYVTDDFEALDITFGEAVVMDATSLNSDSIILGQGPGLVNSGVTYADPGANSLQWNGDDYYFITTKSILSNSSGTIVLNYSGSTMAMGLDLKSFFGYGYSGAMDIYSGSTLIDSVNFTLDGTEGESTFVGYHHAPGINQVIVHSSTWSWSPIIDDHTFNAVPEPGTFAALGLGLMLVLKRRKK